MKETLQSSASQKRLNMYINVYWHEIRQTADDEGMT